MKSRLGVLLGVVMVLALLLILINPIITCGGSLSVMRGIISQMAPLLLMGAALGADALSLSIGIGLRGVDLRDVIRVSLVIGVFHIVMPLAGAVGGHLFGLVAEGIARWVGAGIVAFIGARMVWGCLKNNQCPPVPWTLTGIPLLALALSVSIDALSVGFSLGAFGHSIYVTAIVFGLFGGAMTAVGLLFGNRLGRVIGDRGELLGGIVLIVLALQMFFKG